MRVGRLQSSFARIFTQRCFYLFISLIALIAAGSYASSSSAEGRMWFQAVHLLVLVSAVAAVARTVLPFVIAVLLAILSFGIQFLAVTGLDDPGHAATVVTICYLAFYTVAIVYLMRYVFSADVMTQDKLFGAAAGYIMLGILWAFAYNLVQRYNPEAFGVVPGGEPRTFYDLLFMSFGYLTSNGPGDVVVLGAKARVLVILEQVTGTLFVAILVARLAGIYPQRNEERAE